MQKRDNYVLSIECTELNWNGKDAEILYVSIFFKDMGWYLGVTGKRHNHVYVIYISRMNFSMVLQLYLIIIASLLV